MQQKKGPLALLIATVVAITMMLSMSLGTSYASGDEGDQTPIATATATADDAVVHDSDSSEPADESTSESSPQPTAEPTIPTQEPEAKPEPTNTSAPADDPTEEPTQEPTNEPSGDPTEEPAEGPSDEPTDEPTEEPTEDPVDLPVAGDLLVQCVPGNQISLTNNHTWHALVIAGFDDENGNDVPLTYDVDVYSGTTEYIDITRVPSGTPVGYWIVWMDLEGGSESIENGGSITCGDPEPTEEPVDLPVVTQQCVDGGVLVTNPATSWSVEVLVLDAAGVEVQYVLLHPGQDVLVTSGVTLELWWYEGSEAEPVRAERVLLDCTATPTPEPTDEPTDDPTGEPTTKPTVKPTPSESAKPTVKPTVKPTASSTVQPTAKPTPSASADPTVKPTSKPTVKPSDDKKSDDRTGSPSTGVVDGDGGGMGVVALATILAMSAVAGSVMIRKKN